jgi:nucleotide-binding universal stress UspA family protein
MRVLVGIDDSRGAETALALVTDLTWPAPTSFALVTAYASTSGVLGIAPQTASFDEGSAVPESRPDLLRWLDERAEPLRHRGHLVEVYAERGPAGRVLIDVARESVADLIVVGSRGRGPAASALLGSVSAELADHAPCPVLIARVPRVSRVLLATDGSESAKVIPDVLAQWQLWRRVPVDVLSVAPPPTATMDLLLSAVGTDPSLPDTRVAVLLRHQEFAEWTAGRLADGGWATSAIVRMGDAAREIVTCALLRRSDLIVTGSRGIGDLHRLISGSVAHDVLLHSSCSVLVMRGRVPARVPRTVTESALAS